MYHYAFYGYLAYKAYEYSNLLEHVITIGKGAKEVYSWVYPRKDDSEKDLELVLLVERTHPDMAESDTQTT